MVINLSALPASMHVSQTGYVVNTSFGMRLADLFMINVSNQTLRDTEGWATRLLFACTGYGRIGHYGRNGMN